MFGKIFHRFKKSEVNKEKKVAIFIDAENVSTDCYERIFKESSSLGKVTIKRAYGCTLSGNQVDSCKKFGITPTIVFTNVKGKNSTDFKMYVDIMEVMFTDKANVFVVASSDTDFIPLYTKLMEYGNDVHVYGKDNTKQNFLNYCTDFIPIEYDISDAKTSNQNSNCNSSIVCKSNANDTDGVDETKLYFKPTHEDYVTYIIDVWSQYKKDGWVEIAHLGNIHKVYPGTFSKYNCSSMKSFIGCFEGVIDIKYTGSQTYFKPKDDKVFKKYIPLYMIPSNAKLINGISHDDIVKYLLDKYNYNNVEGLCQVSKLSDIVTDYPGIIKRYNCRSLNTFIYKFDDVFDIIENDAKLFIKLKNSKCEEIIVVESQLEV